jgi:DNA-binding response OmpR family regulator
MLPGAGGMEVAELLRADGYESVPLLAITASRHLADLARESRLFRAVLEKPFELDELLLCVRELLGESGSASAETTGEPSETPNPE